METLKNRIAIRDIKELLNALGIEISAERIRQLAVGYTTKFNQRKGIGGGLFITSAKAKKIIKYFVMKEKVKKWRI